MRTIFSSVRRLVGGMVARSASPSGCPKQAPVAGAPIRLLVVLVFVVVAAVPAGAQVSSDLSVGVARVHLQDEPVLGVVGAYSLHLSDQGAIGALVTRGSGDGAWSAGARVLGYFARRGAPVRPLLFGSVEGRFRPRLVIRPSGMGSVVVRILAPTEGSCV